MFEYPSFESVDMDQSADIKEKEEKRENQQSSKPQQTQSIFKTNSSVVGSSGNSNIFYELHLILMNQLS